MLEINRTADYVVLWKSHRRAERAALGLARQAAELRGLLAAGLPELAVTAGVAVGAAVAVESLPGVTVGAAAAARPAAAIESLPGELAVAAPAAEPASVGAAVADWAEAEFLEAESGRMWELYAELGAELAQVAGLLTAAQRQTAEKVIQEWEEGGEG